ncbi:uncharacterized protein IWZ02DRAFT_34779 [Phyllosticta citriasiana]|uniref:uncharacterized protein n=1 Tax=Phyllosticta citriasiana TaxID=595635 RepID=UPI0030FD6E74
MHPSSALCLIPTLRRLAQSALSADRLAPSSLPSTRRRSRHHHHHHHHHDDDRPDRSCCSPEALHKPEPPVAIRNLSSHTLQAACHGVVEEGLQPVGGCISLQANGCGAAISKNLAGTAIGSYQLAQQQQQQQQQQHLVSFNFCAALSPVLV